MVLLPPHHTPSMLAQGAPRMVTPPQTPTKQGVTALAPSSPWHRDEARMVLEDLSNFIALGCLASREHFEAYADAEEWSSIYFVPASLALDRWQLLLNDLISAGWIRVTARSGHCDNFGTILRVYLLAGDVGHRHINRSDRQARTRYEALRMLIAELDISASLWHGDATSSHEPQKMDLWATPETSSLHWIFNNNPSPAPDPNCIENSYRRQAMDDILTNSLSVRGLKSSLYPYQRRSAAFMLQRESEGKRYLDPRLEPRQSPDGSTFYYCARDFMFLRHPITYEAGKGGILAETMGLGKTVITLALVLATRSFLPKIPVEYSTTKSSGPTRSLMDICVEKINRSSVPWKPYFEDYERRTGESLANCSERLRRSVCSYEIPRIPVRFNRTTTIPPPVVKILAPTTIIVVPRNLCSQWQSEIEKHVEPSALKVLIMEDLREALPHHDTLREYDVILFSRNRFEQESRDGSDEQGRRFSKTPLSCACPYIKATRKRDCTCLRTEDIYHSPLKNLHFLRIVIDEGHTFSSSTSMAAVVAEKLVTADHRWVVSGTPAKNLLGVEMDLYTSDITPLPLNDKSQRDSILQQRKNFTANEDTKGAIQSLGSLVTHFLQIKPWNGGSGERLATWDEYIYRHEDTRKKTFTSYSRALRQTLEAVVIKTQPEDVEKDMELPPLTHDIIKLEPSFYDKVTSNLFTFVLTANAVLSERTDRDYIFHKDSTKARHELIGNLRQSAFFWTGFSIANIESAIELSEKYLAKDEIKCSEEDQLALKKCIAMARRILNLEGWRKMSTTHEFGFFVDDWPSDSAEYWTFDGTQPLLTGATLLAEAQEYVHLHLSEPDIESRLSGEGIRTMLRALARGREETHAADSSSKSPDAVPAQGMTAEPSKAKSYHPKKRPRPSDMDAPPSPTLPLPSLPAASPLLSTKLTGTVSAKMSYLLSQIAQHSPNEKILIFYTGANAAYYLAQALELLHIQYLIYAKTLPSATKSRYIVDFASNERIRVLLMDVHQAAHGLNVVAASRVYFINPVCKAQVEAQAVKRAHRIGQKAHVRVETLVLKGGVEERIFERARGMSRAEQSGVLEDDGGVREIVSAGGIVPLGDEHEVARLEHAEKLWCRPGWGEWVRSKESPRKKRKTTTKGDSTTEKG